MQASNATLKAQVAEQQAQFAHNTQKQQEKFEFAVAHWEKESARLSTQVPYCLEELLTGCHLRHCFCIWYRTSNLYYLADCRKRITPV